jgi:hypothetical protein
MPSSRLNVNIGALGTASVTSQRKCMKPENGLSNLVVTFIVPEPFKLGPHNEQFTLLHGLVTVTSASISEYGGAQLHNFHESRLHFPLEIRNHLAKLGRILGIPLQVNQVNETTYRVNFGPFSVASISEYNPASILNYLKEMAAPA